MTRTPDFIDPRLPRHEVEILLLELLKTDRAGLMLRDPKLSRIQHNKFLAWQKELKRGYPLQYILGKAHFLDLELFVNENVLIPRPETELLAELALKQGAKNILEVGCGSGCIIIYLATKQKAKFTALDLSVDALKVARKNAKKYNVKIDFKKSDLFQKIKNQKFDLIIANLPYGTKAQMKNVKFEPQMAVLGGKQGFEIIERLIANAKTQLSKNGTVLLEIDPTQTKILKSSTVRHGFDLKIIKDLNGRDRIGVLTVNSKLHRA